VNTECGRDGRPLITTGQAALSLGKSPAAFKMWANRRGIRPAGYRTTGERGRPQALWDLADITDAITTRPI
jgi:hypothetical protein